MATFPSYDFDARGMGSAHPMRELFIMIYNEPCPHRDDKPCIECWTARITQSAVYKQVKEAQI